MVPRDLLMPVQRLHVPVFFSPASLFPYRCSVLSFTLYPTLQPSLRRLVLPALHQIEA